MNIFIKVAMILVVTLIGVFVAFIVVNTPWVSATVSTYAAIANQASPTVQSAPTASPCAYDAKEYAKSIDSLYTEWQDALNLADSSPRMSLPPAVAHLQEIRRKMSEIEVKPCMETVHSTLILAMDQGIKGYLSFMAQEPDGVVQGHFDSFRTLMEAATSQISIAVGK